MPPSIIREFLGQSAELLDRLDTDFAVLSRSPHDAVASDRMAGALSALRTGAGFLDLAEFERGAARAAEVLRETRQSSGAHDAELIASLGRAIDALRASKSEIERTVGNDAPLAKTVVAAPVVAAPVEAPEMTGGHTLAVERRPLRLDESKSALVEFMVEDLRDGIAVAEQAIGRVESPVGREGGASELRRLGAELLRTARFFELAGLEAMAVALASAGAAIPTMSEETRGQVTPRLHAIIELLHELADGLAYSTVVVRPIRGVCEAVRALVEGADAPAIALLPDNCPAITVLELDGVVAKEKVASNAIIEPALEAPRASGESTKVPATPVASESVAEMPQLDASASESAARVERKIAAASSEHAVPASRLDVAASVMGNMVAQANRLAALPQDVSAAIEPRRLVTRVSHIADDVARATSDMRAAVLDARALPVGVLFGACVEAAEDGAANVGMKIMVGMEGDGLEIDAGVIDRLRGPLAMLAGACAGVARPDADSPQMMLAVSIDDATDTAQIVLRCTTRAGGFSADAPEVGSLRSAVEAIRGVLTCEIDPTGGVEFTVRVPTNLAFLHCTLVRFGSTLAAIPMSGIDEIVKPEPDQIVGTGNSRVVLVRDGAAALLDGQELFGETGEARAAMPYVVVVSHGGRRVALACGRALGAQEVVLRPMDPMPSRVGGGPISGIGAASDGAAALIVDVPGLVRLVEGRSTGEAGGAELGIAA